MRLLSALLLLALAGVLPAAAARADGPGEIPVSILAVDDGNYPEVRVVFTADLNGRPLTSLAMGEVAATEGGIAADVVVVERAAEASIPMALVITLDVSGSVAGATLAEAKAAATALVNGLGPGDSAAVVSFADDVRVVQPLTSAKPGLTAAIGGLQPGGNTALYDAVSRSAALASGSGVARRAVVLFSDGQDYGGRSAEGREGSLATAAAGGALFYVVAIGSQVDRAYLSELATRSGGRLFEATGPAEVPALLASLQGHLRSQFVATLRSRADGAARERSVEIRVAQGSAAGAATKAYSSRREPPAPTALPAQPVAEEAVRVATEPAVAASEPVVAGGEGGIGLSVLVWGSLLALLAALGMLVPVVRWRSRPVAIAGGGEDTATLPVPVAPPADESRWQIVVTGGAASARVGLSGAPLLVGSGPACEVRLPEAPGVAAEHARIWLRDGRAMLHHLAGGCVTLVGGREATLASLTKGTEFTIGPYVLRLVDGREPCPVDESEPVGPREEALAVAAKLVPPGDDGRAPRPRGRSV